MWVEETPMAGLFGMGDWSSYCTKYSAPDTNQVCMAATSASRSMILPVARLSACSAIYK